MEVVREEDTDVTIPRTTACLRGGTEEDKLVADYLDRILLCVHRDDDEVRRDEADHIEGIGRWRRVDDLHTVAVRVDD